VTRPLIGVLALQGDVAEHRRVLEGLGADACGVRTEEELARVDGLILPGGESTTIVKLADAFGLADPIRHRIHSGMPVYGSCAGMILLADDLADAADGQRTFGGLDATVRRNAFGRQVDSFESQVAFADWGEPVHAVFIRAPRVERTGPLVEVLARTEDGPGAGSIVAVRQGGLLATSFHPEITGDTRIHRMFVEIVKGQR
jgi:pyridoxal 5'-phosphate synthase pdxT subunit